MRQCIKTLLAAIVVGLGFTAFAQVPQEAKSLQNFERIFYRNTPQGKMPAAVCIGKEAIPMDAGRVEIKGFELQTLRDGKTVQFVARAPQAILNVKDEYANSTGPLRGFNANTNFYIEGVGFLCTKSNSLLIISNNVETRIEKAAIKGSLPFENAARAERRALPTNEVLKIFGDQFRLLYQSNIATYHGHVRVVDPRLTLTCELLTTRFGTNNSIESIVAERNVVLTDTNGSRATGERGIYTLVGTNETIELIGHAHWNDGHNDATARSFFYDGRTDELKANDGVKVRYGNNAHRKPRSTNDFSDLIANTATIFNATRKHSKLQDIFAQGDVMMTNHFDHTYAQGYRAVYTDSNGVVEVTGNTLLKNEHGQVSGNVLTIDRSNAVFRSHGNTKAMMISVGAKKGVEQKVFVNGTDLIYSTNEATVTGEVTAYLMNGEARMADLTSHSLYLKLGPSNQLIRAVAQDNVSVKRTDAKHRAGTLWCDSLTVNRNAKTGLLVDALAEGHCRFEETNSVPKPAFKMLTASNFFAQFSPVTNKVERFTASGDVNAIQVSGKRTNEMHGAKMVYTFKPVEKIDVTGNPKAFNERASISDANIFTYFVKSNTFRATGPYKIVPTGRTNPLSSR